MIDLIKQYSCIKHISNNLDEDKEVNFYHIEKNIEPEYIEKNLFKINGYIQVGNNLSIKNFLERKFNKLFSDNSYSVFYNHDIIIQFNRYSSLHNNKNIFFAHMGQLGDITRQVTDLKEKAILITGNSDYILQPENEKNNEESEIFVTIPDNVQKWFTANCFSNNLKIQILPAGIENSVDCKRTGHGVGWPAAIEKKNLLSQKYNVIPTKKIYANFHIGSNPPHRTAVKNICENKDYVTLKNYGIPYAEFVSDILDHEAVICPQGNGGSGDNHRIYETLYLRRIPITFNKKLYNKLHNLFPVVLLNNVEELGNIQELDKKIQEAKAKTFFYLDFYYWEKLILDEYSKL